MDYMIEAEARTALKEQIVNVAVWRSAVPVKLACGRESDIYIELDRVMYGSFGFNLAGRLLWPKLLRLIGNEPCHAVGGPVQGAIMMAGALLAAAAREHNTLRAFAVRKKAKGHGIKELISGRLCSADQVVICDDLTTTGASAMRAVRAVERAGAKVLGVLSMVDRGAAEQFAAANIPFATLFTMEDLGLTERA